MEVLLKNQRVPNTIPVLILSPTRELAAQIAAEAQALLTFHTGMKGKCPPHVSSPLIIILLPPPVTMVVVIVMMVVIIVLI